MLTSSSFKFSVLILIFLVVISGCQRLSSRTDTTQSTPGEQNKPNSPSILSIVLECAKDTAWVSHAVEAKGYLKNKGWKQQLTPGVEGSIVVALCSASGDTLAMKRFDNPREEHVEAPLLPDAPGTPVVLVRDTASIHVRTSLPASMLAVAEDDGTYFKELSAPIQILAILQDN